VLIDGISKAYNYIVIKQLIVEVTLREAGIQALLSEGDLSHRTLVFEDLIQEFSSTLRKVWVQRFRYEIQEIGNL
jgi:hypothetical protein